MSSRTVVLVVRGTTEVPMFRLDDATRLDLGTVDGLARLQLAARRMGRAIHVRDASAELRALLELAGLAALLLEVRRETESGEELGVEEVVMPGDPPV